jgi:hypothetical protein
MMMWVGSEGAGGEQRLGTEAGGKTRNTAQVHECWLQRPLATGNKMGGVRLRRVASGL